ncbi:MAG TPA: ornithine cyclodeaminase family protein [Chloroflexota bacterium]|nr:ornithine cyclodeaminase family protein [Chloroflexota bacterium]
MVLLLTHDDVRAAVTMADAVVAMERAFREQGEGLVTQPQRLNVKAGKGWLRVGPAVLEGSGWMGFKAMNLCPGQGVRYMIALYSVADGALQAIMDAQHLTTLRTGGTSAVATRLLARAEPTTVAVLGSGVEARAQLEAMHAIGLARGARVWSPTVANRERFATEMSAALGIPVEAVADGRAAVRGHGDGDAAGLVVAAVRSPQTVLAAEWLAPGTHVNSVGTARPDQREIDPATFQRAAVVVVDTREGVFGEAGDALAAREVFSPEDAHELADLVAGRAPRRADDAQVTLFKSVGTAVQDVALAAMVFEQARARGLGQPLPAGFPFAKA